jgi:hypothetical protein
MPVATSVDAPVSAKPAESQPPSSVVHPQNFDSGLRRPTPDKTSVPKISFEQGTGVLVWDIGTKPGFVDSGDNLTDLSETCGLPTQVSFLIQFRSLPPKSLIQIS